MVELTGQNPILAYFGHHKCASTWIMQVLARIASEIGVRHRIVVDELTPQATGPLTDYRARFGRADLRRHVVDAGAELVMCLNADRLQADTLSPARAFHVIRDPRDIIVSAYFSHRNTHPTHNHPHLQHHRENLRSTDLANGLLMEMDFSSTGLMQLADWDYSNDKILELRMEDLTPRPYDGFIRIFDHLGLLEDNEPVLASQQARVWLLRLCNRLSNRPALGVLKHRIPATGEIVLGNVYAQRFETHSAGRKPGDEDVASHFRKGVAGDWRNYFTRAHCEAFEERFGGLLIKLAYEKDSDWIAQASDPA